MKYIEEVFLKTKNKKKRQYGCERYKTLPEDEEKKSLLSTEKNIIKWEETSHHNYKKLSF